MSEEAMHTQNDEQPLPLKQIEVVAAIIQRPSAGAGIPLLTFATQRGYGEWKNWWEFPGGKMEPGESPEEALVREIREELASDISVGERLCTVEYDYPKFHLTMHCYLCTLINGHLTLLEHEAARWLSLENLNSVMWLPADQEVVAKLIALQSTNE